MISLVKTWWCGLPASQKVAPPVVDSVWVVLLRIACSQMHIFEGLKVLVDEQHAVNGQGGWEPEHPRMVENCWYDVAAALENPHSADRKMEPQSFVLSSPTGTGPKTQCL